MPIRCIHRIATDAAASPFATLRACPVRLAERRVAVVPLTEAQIAQVHGGSVEGDAALRAFPDRRFAAVADEPRWPILPEPTYDGAL